MHLLHLGLQTATYANKSSMIVTHKCRPIFSLLSFFLLFVLVDVVAAARKCDTEIRVGARVHF